ncbi:hypothetical protein F4824DRAFT_439658 [Ustulina deusta]|nr:hypothetical protein F4824DRAFT_439658 [Ustulina deusta]
MFFFFLLATLLSYTTAVTHVPTPRFSLYGTYRVQCTPRPEFLLAVALDKKVLNTYLPKVPISKLTTWSCYVPCQRGW